MVAKGNSRGAISLDSIQIMVLMIARQGGWTVLVVAKGAQIKVGKTSLGSQGTYKMDRVTAQEKESTYSFSGDVEQARCQ